MKIYWDSSALVEAHLDETLHNRLKREGAYTRTHSLAEVFSTLTGGKFPVRVDANHAANTIKEMVQHLELVDLTAKEIAESLLKAQAKGVRGGRVHDYIHALAAEKCGAKTLLTLDENDFHGLIPNLKIEVF